LDHVVSCTNIADKEQLSVILKGIQEVEVEDGRVRLKKETLHTCPTAEVTAIAYAIDIKGKQPARRTLEMVGETEVVDSFATAFQTYCESPRHNDVTFKVFRFAENNRIISEFKAGRWRLLGFRHNKTFFITNVIFKASDRPVASYYESHRIEDEHRDRFNLQRSKMGRVNRNPSSPGPDPETRGSYLGHLISQSRSAVSHHLDLPIGGYIGHGKDGCVFESHDEVIKFTFNYNEAEVASYVGELYFPQFPEIYEIYDMTAFFNISVYAILREEIPDSWLESHVINALVLISEIPQPDMVLDDVYFEIDKFMDTNLHLLGGLDTSTESDYLIWQLIAEFSEFVITCFDIGIFLGDVGHNNIGQREDGTIVIRDLGNCTILDDINLDDGELY